MKRLCAVGLLGCGWLLACSSSRETVESPRGDEALKTPVATPVLAPTAAPAAPLASPPTPSPSVIEPAQVGFLGAPDEPVLARLRDGEITEIKKGSGGRSLGFKLTLSNGQQAYFKPEQSFSGANWYAEVAAYALDRALGLGRVPPVVSRELSWAQLRKAAGDDARVSEVKVVDGKVRGALIAWVDGGLTPWPLQAGWEEWIRVEPWNPYNPTPYQRARAYYDALNQPSRGRAYEVAPTPDRADRAAELSDLIVLDFLTLNIDRWGGDNGNVLMLGDRGPLVFLDNGAAFAHGPPLLRLMTDRLAPLQKFRRATLDAVRALDLAAFAARLAADPLAPILSEADLEGLAIRRIAVLDHAAELQQKHGDQILAW